MLITSSPCYLHNFQFGCVREAGLSAVLSSCEFIIKINSTRLFKAPSSKFLIINSFIPPPQVFCTDCISEWLSGSNGTGNKTCPIDKTPIKINLTDICKKKISFALSNIISDSLVM